MASECTYCKVVKINTRLQRFFIRKYSIGNGPSFSWLIEMFVHRLITSAVDDHGCELFLL